MRLHGLRGPARYVDHATGPYGEDWCHVSAKHKAMTDGGRRVHGWALWLFGKLVMGDHHSVWQNPDGELVDVTPPKYGESRVLFLRDDAAIIEREGDTLYFLTNRSSVVGAENMWMGRITEYTHTDCPMSRKDLVGLLRQNRHGSSRCRHRQHPRLIERALPYLDRRPETAQEHRGNIIEHMHMCIYVQVSRKGDRHE